LPGPIERMSSSMAGVARNVLSCLASIHKFLQTVLIQIRAPKNRYVSNKTAARAILCFQAFVFGNGGLIWGNDRKRDPCLILIRTAAPSRSPGQPGAEHLMMSPDKQAELIRDVAATKLLPSEAEIPEASCH
jgi:hypothetical protein